MTPVPFEAPEISPHLVVKGWAIQQVQQAALHQILLILAVGALTSIG